MKTSVSINHCSCSDHFLVFNITQALPLKRHHFWVLGSQTLKDALEFSGYLLPSSLQRISSSRYLSLREYPVFNSFLPPKCLSTHFIEFCLNPSVILQGLFYFPYITLKRGKEKDPKINAQPKIKEDVRRAKEIP